MNKRQKKKQEKKQRDFIDKKKLEWQEIEVGDIVEVIGRRYGGYLIGTLAIVATPPPRQTGAMSNRDDLCISDELNAYDEWAMIHHREDLNLIKKGSRK